MPETPVHWSNYWNGSELRAHWKIEARQLGAWLRTGKVPSILTTTGVLIREEDRLAFERDHAALLLGAQRQADRRAFVQRIADTQSCFLFPELSRARAEHEEGRS